LLEIFILAHKTAPERVLQLLGTPACHKRFRLWHESLADFHQRADIEERPIHIEHQCLHCPPTICVVATQANLQPSPSGCLASISRCHEKQSPTPRVAPLPSAACLPGYGASAAGSRCAAPYELENYQSPNAPHNDL